MDLIDITITSGWITLIVIGVIVLLIFLYSQFDDLKNKVHRNEVDSVKLQAEVSEKNLLIEKIQTDAKGYAQDLAIKQFDEWKLKEMESLKQTLEGAANDSAKASLQNWIFLNEERIRKDAAHRSLKVNMGKVTEHLLPFSYLFEQFNPKDARFIGSPIDLVVFDGVCDKKDLVNIYFVEIKTGTSALSQTQKKIRDAIASHRIHWLPINLKDEVLDLDLEG